MDLVERYIEAVVRYLPPRQRADITRELRSLIEDMLQQRAAGREPGAEDVEAVLLELGDPRRLADNYRGSSRCLISPVFFDLYWLVLRIVLAAAGGGVLLATALEMAAHPPDSAWAAIAGIIGNLYNALIGAFGVVTLIFALNDRFNEQASEAMAKIKGQWHPSQLPPRMVKGLPIKRSDPIVALIFLFVALIVINVNIDLIGLYIQNGGSVSITPLISDRFQTFLPWLNLSIGLAILAEMIKLIVGRWTVPIVLGSLIQKTLSLVITLQMFADQRIFNSDFFPAISRLFRNAAPPLPDSLPGRICQIILILAVVAYVIDLLTIGWKGVRILLGRGARPAGE